MDVWYITLENDYMSPSFGENYFEETVASDTISIIRSGEVVNKAFIYIFKNLQKIPPDALQEARVAKN
jgi:hypothetical protein